MPGHGDDGILVWGVNDSDRRKDARERPCAAEEVFMFQNRLEDTIFSAVLVYKL